MFCKNTHYLKRNKKREMVIGVFRMRERDGCQSRRRE